MAALHLLALTVLLAFTSQVDGQCSPQGQEISRVALSKVGSQDYSYNSWHSFSFHWFTRKDGVFIKDVMEEAQVPGGYMIKKTFGISYKTASRARDFKKKHVAAVGYKDEFHWDRVNCQNVCPGDIIAGESAAGADDAVVGIVTQASATPRQTTYVSHDTDAVVTDEWPFRHFDMVAEGKTIAFKYVCWRFVPSEKYRGIPEEAKAA